MTARDLATWSAVYAVAWFHAPTHERYGGSPGDAERAQLAATHADRALAALQLVRPEGESLEDMITRMPMSESPF